MAASDDPFSKLPDDIIRHHILKFITGAKDIVKASAVSNSWLRLRQTSPFLYCDIFDLVPDVSYDEPPSDERKAKTEQFIKFVDQSFNNLKIRSINSFDLVTGNTTADEVPGWICRALDKHVQDLDVRIEDLDIDYGSIPDPPCLIPSRVFSADWINSLILKGDFAFPVLIENNVNLSSLTVLRLSGSIVISDEQLQQLLHGCPILREILLSNCYQLSEIDISNNPNLECLHLACFSRDAVMVRVRVRAPKLKELRCYQTDRLNLKVHCSPNLKSLTITSSELNDDLFHKFLTQFPLLETLSVSNLDRLRKIRISNPLLKSIYLKDIKGNLEDVIIDCKNLSIFTLSHKDELPTAPIRPSIRMDSPPYICAVSLTVHTDKVKANLYLQLKEYLTLRQPIFRHLRILIFDGASSVADTENETADLPSSACEIEKLSLNAYASYCSSSILNGVLSACHPTTIELLVTPENISFVKLICEEFANRQGNCKCWCKDDFKCWKHQLKVVKIEKIAGIKVDKEKTLDWDILDSLLTTLKEVSFIFFRLWW